MDETRDGREKEGGQGFLSGKDQPHKPNRNIASLTPEMFFSFLDGFVILDDPLVDLDPVRQQATAAVIKSFSEDKQVIVLTCHPAHADLLGGNLIALKDEQPLKLGSGVSGSATNS